MSDMNSTTPSIPTASPSPAPMQKKSSTGRIILGILFLLSPFVFGVMAIAFIISAGFAASTQTSSSGLSPFMMAGGFGGVLLLILLMLLSPVLMTAGLFMLVHREVDPNVPYDPRSGSSSSVLPEEIKGWNWGAAGLPLIWGAYHHVYLSLIRLIPVVGMFWWIVMGLKGNEWAWKATRWESVDQFKKSQEQWKMPGLILFVLFDAVPMLFFFLSLVNGSLSMMFRR